MTSLLNEVKKQYQEKDRGFLENTRNLFRKSIYSEEGEYKNSVDYTMKDVVEAIKNYGIKVIFILSILTIFLTINGAPFGESLLASGGLIIFFLLALGILYMVLIIPIGIFGSILTDTIYFLYMYAITSYKLQKLNC